MLFCVPRNQSRPWPLPREGFSPAPEGATPAHLKASSKSFRPRTAGWFRELVYEIGPLKPMTFSFAKPTTDFTLQLPWGQLCIGFFHFSRSLCAFVALAEGQLPRIVRISREFLRMGVVPPLGKHWDVIFDMLCKKTITHFGKSSMWCQMKTAQLYLRFCKCWPFY